ncbi:hypothetical protein BOTBODRAFT_184642 [Botryobasidium botryosum FD-172 SS1]|uniref:OsmC-like protein n=1 Tax=Botryobasidium botryosum (strain FD-172 SS1) TaxID=930990 RepID=A0A067MSP9_BOTB1|nr:hypothetical protein BOTBODRAFT_184642 [Botryobasidium botryosum FD-172 SS1]
MEGQSVCVVLTAPERWTTAYILHIYPTSTITVIVPRAKMSFALRAARPAFSRAGFALQRRTILTLKDHKYTAHATAQGSGRNGSVSSPDGPGLSVTLALPKALGGTGEGHNPEQLFAMGYASCFLGALQLVASKSSSSSASAAKDAKVHAQVHIGEPNGKPGFGLSVEITVEGISDEALVKAAHETCPYSRALSLGADVKVSLK